MIVELFAATKGRLSASTVPLAQDRGKTLTAAPVSIKYLHLLRLSATYSSLEGDNLEVSVITQSCRVSFGSPDTRVATLCWLNSFKAKAQYRGLCTNAAYHQISDQCIVCSRWLCGTGLRRVRQRSGRAGIWYFCGNNILVIIFITIIICSHARCKSLALALGKKFYFLLFCLFCELSAAYCYIVAFDVLKFLTFLVFWKCLPLFQ